MGSSLEGRVVLVAGGGRGIGRACALLAAQEGARVLVNDAGGDPSGGRSEASPASEVVTEIERGGGEAEADASDISTMAGGASAVDHALDRWGRLDGLVNMAGILRGKSIFSLTEDEWDDVVRVHLKGHFSLIQRAVTVMRGQGYGRIVACTSTAALYGQIGMPNYAAAKAGIVGLVRGVSREVGHLGITVNAIAPAATTRLGSVFRPSLPAIRAELGLAAESEVAGDAYFRKITEEDRAGLRSPELIGPLVGYLLSPGSWNVNGRVFVAEGRAIAVCPDDLPVRTVYTQDGPWSVDGLTTIVPDVLLAGMPNPAPPNPDARPDGRVAAGEPRVD